MCSLAVLVATCPALNVRTMELGKATTFGQRYDDGDAHVVEIGEQFVDMSALVLALVWDSVSVL